MASHGHVQGAHLPTLSIWPENDLFFPTVYSLTPYSLLSTLYNLLRKTRLGRNRRDEGLKSLLLLPLRCRSCEPLEQGRQTVQAVVA